MVAAAARDFWEWGAVMSGFLETDAVVDVLLWHQTHSSERRNWIGRESRGGIGQLFGILQRSHALSSQTGRFDAGGTRGLRGRGNGVAATTVGDTRMLAHALRLWRRQQ
jgi:hypothetical protein